ncbi:serine/threonine-protein phosphatase 4 regulatory subunit 2-A-like isoform X2 [Gadus macrocephalus]|uniref:serine/threonine-protein phosphatase 4 regulatory subunit 2-A-like isoform X2 n=1 Tax=Gadus macrocephalus TaxID=80720 RepID=UPI0028CB91D4|nr:serine/threonine-protein phosphatase 4 regulatory subunit 2-A-like isoform X2 [Gadus macrocephalus]
MIYYDFLRQMCVVVAREINAVLKRLVARGRIEKYSVCITSDSDFEKKETKESCPILEQLLIDVAKTGETFIPWSKFKTYFLFKMENVMDDFHASSPEQRGSPNPNVVYVPFDAMKERIVKIVDGYSGVPFTIQRLCELVTDPTRNYSGTEKFLRGVEKNVMVVSCVRPPSEKNGESTVSRMNGGPFPDSSSVHSDSILNGPVVPPKPLTISFSTNGPPSAVDSRERQPPPEDGTERHISGSMSQEGEGSPRARREKSQRWGTEDRPYRPLQEVKRLKVEHREEEDTAGDEGERRASTSPTGSGVVTETQESPRGTGKTGKNAAPSGAVASGCSEPGSPTSPPSNRPEESSNSETDLDPDLTLQTDMTTDPSERLDPSGTGQSPEGQNNGDGSADGASLNDNKLPLSSACSTADLPTEGAAESK